MTKVSFKMSQVYIPIKVCSSLDHKLAQWLKDSFHVSAEVAIIIFPPTRNLPILTTGHSW